MTSNGCKDGKFIAASDDNGLKLFRVDAKKGEIGAGSTSHGLARLAIEPQFESSDGVPVHLRFGGTLKVWSNVTLCPLAMSTDKYIGQVTKSRLRDAVWHDSCSAELEGGRYL